MRYFNYGSTQGYEERPIYTVQLTRGGGNKLGVLEKQVKFPGGVLKEIESVETKIKQGTWGWVPTKQDDPAAGKAAGLLCVSTRGTGLNTKTVWYQIGVDSNGQAFAELGWQVGGLKGSMLKTYNQYTITNDTVLKMVPNGKTVEFHFGSHVEELTWNQNPSDWIGSGAPNFDWDETNKIAWIRQQIEAYWGNPSVSSPSSKMELPGTRSNPFEFGPTKYKEKSKIDTEIISGNEFLLPLTGNDPNFRRSSKDDKVKLWSSKNR